MEEFSKKKLDDLTYEVIGAAIEVHKIMGKGLLENVYHKCMMEELSLRKVNFKSELKIPVSYKEKELEIDYRCDLFVDDILVVELKSVNDIHPIVESQILTYMRLLSAPKGLLINFNCNNIFYEGQKTFVNEYYKILK